MPYLLVAVGLLALIVGAEGVVRGGSRVASGLGIPSVVVGLTVVSIGTSAPELAVGIRAAAQGSGSLAVGNIAGTNMVNLLLILGMSAAIRPLAIRSQTFRTDLPAMAAAALVLLLLSLDRTLSRVDGALLLGLAIVYTVVIIRLSRRGRVAEAAASEKEDSSNEDSSDEDEGSPARRDVARHVALLLVGLVLIVLGAEWLVDGAVQVARSFGVSDAVIGLTVVAIGTSAPELVTTVVSTIRNDRGIAIGNLIGSSVYNIALVLGATALTAPVPLEEALVRVDLPLMTGVVLLCIPVFLTGRRMSRWEGGLFVCGYLAYLTYLLLTRI